MLIIIEVEPIKGKRSVDIATAVLEVATVRYVNHWTGKKNKEGDGECEPNQVHALQIGLHQPFSYLVRCVSHINPGGLSPSIQAENIRKPIVEVMCPFFFASSLASESFVV